MKTNRADPSRPRLTCRLVQGWISIVGEGDPATPGAAGRRHVESCECCREFFRSSEELERSLRRVATRERDDVPAGLDRRIVAAVERARAERPRRTRSFAPAIVCALAGAAAALAMVFSLTDSSPPTAADVVMRDELPEPVGEGVHEMATEGVWTWVRPSTGALLEGEPLQREVDAVYSDVRSAVDFLALNFLPVRGSNSTGNADGAFAPNRAADG